MVIPLYEWQPDEASQVHASALGELATRIPPDLSWDKVEPRMADAWNKLRDRHAPVWTDVRDEARVAWQVARLTRADRQCDNAPVMHAS
jgi:hypothetical protein